MNTVIPKITSFKTADALRTHARSLDCDLSLDDAILPAPASPLAAPISWQNCEIGNRWAILPMEGWDCTSDGSPSDLMRRRWLNFARSGAKLIFGCEAAAVMPSGRSNTRQLLVADHTAPALAALLADMRSLHGEKFGRIDDLAIGLQLTHSGRYSHPHDDKKLEPLTAYSNPLLDKKFSCTAAHVASDDQVRDIIAHYIRAARLAAQIGFDFVDIKMAHGYLGFEFLGAIYRTGPYGGSLDNRTRFFREIIQGIQQTVPSLKIATRLSLADMMPFEKGLDSIGRPMSPVEGFGAGNYPFAFGGDGTGLGFDLTETFAFLDMARTLGVELICTTLASPYYIPHVQRPAYYPVSDGYLPPEDPILGAARHIAITKKTKEKFKNTNMIFVGSGYTCLQDYLVQTAQKTIRDNGADLVGIGRMALSYPELPADTLAGLDLQRRKICRTFGDCTTAPRAGMVSGCYPLDDFYKCRPEAQCLKTIAAARKDRPTPSASNHLPTAGSPSSP